MKTQGVCLWRYRRTFLTDVASVGIAATAGPLLHVAPTTIERPQNPGVSTPPRLFL